MVLDDETLSQTPSNPETWNNPDPSSPQAALFPSKLDRGYLRPPNALVLYTVFLGEKNWENVVMRRLSKHLEMARGILRRDPTQDEINAFVEHTSREVNTRELGLPIGLLAGMTHAEFFLRRRLGVSRQSPTIWKDYQRAWTQAAQKDRRAVVFQSALRVSFWVLLSMGNFQGFGTYRFTLGLGSDERLGAFREAVKRYANARMQRLEGTSDQVRQRREGREASRHPGTVNAEEYPQPDYGRGGESSSSIAGSVDSSAWGKEQKQTDFTDSFFQNDDASPVAYEFRKQDNTNEYNTPTNSWERIRQERAQGRQSTVNSPAEWRKRAYEKAQQEQSQNAATDYSTEEKNRQQDRDAAQREFDRMLDAERQASQSDSDGFDENKKTGWRRW